MTRATRAQRRDQPPPPTRDWLVTAIAAVGVVLAGYLAVTKLLGGRVLLCTEGTGCGVVQATRFAEFLGLPVGVWGAVLYGAIGSLALVGLSAARWLLAFVLAVAAVSFSAYLTYLEIFVIEAICGYCVASAAIAAALVGVLLARRPAPVGRRSPTRPGRVAGWGVLTALATLVVGIGVHALTAPTAAASYQVALARHLADTGAVMYGAFW